jgi:hypothetical protein
VCMCVRNVFGESEFAASAFVAASSLLERGAFRDFASASGWAAA